MQITKIVRPAGKVGIILSIVLRLAFWIRHLSMAGRRADRIVASNRNDIPQLDQILDRHPSQAGHAWRSRARLFIALESIKPVVAETDYPGFGYPVRATPLIWFVVANTIIVAMDGQITRVFGKIDQILKRGPDISFVFRFEEVTVQAFIFRGVQGCKTGVGKCVDVPPGIPKLLRLVEMG